MFRGTECQCGDGRQLWRRRWWWLNELDARAVHVNVVTMAGSRSLGTFYDSQSAGGLVGGASQRVRSRNVLTSEKGEGQPRGAAPGRPPGAGRAHVSLEDLILGGAPCVPAKATWRKKRLFIGTFISHKRRF